MAILRDPHWERVPPVLREVIVEVGRQPFARRFYLAGGTAVALQLGHRVSVDLDFFSAEDELLDDSRQEIVAALRECFPLDVTGDKVGNLHLDIRGSVVGFMGYGYPLLEPTILVEGVALADLVDIGLMKMDAVASRGARKDFTDLYFIGRHIPLVEILERGAGKYPLYRDFGMRVLEALADFEHADRDEAIETFPPVSWELIKRFFVTQVRHIGYRWFEA